MVLLNLDDIHRRPPRRLARGAIRLRASSLMPPESKAGEAESWREAFCHYV
jgi:hypothetical protein